MLSLPTSQRTHPAAVVKVSFALGLSAKKTQQQYTAAYQLQKKLG